MKVFLAVEPVDMRKGFNGLSNIVRHHFKHDVFSGHLFAFFDRRRDRAKILFWGAVFARSSLR
ncbi:MAG: IS66 family insertion sequence element accessory protein TnpB [Deltaproteobacteria bacterium]|nr:IS66 family insertion sequence element accessory protein TnpB [Deltaproteobacteria bacterium]